MGETARLDDKQLPLLSMILSHRELLDGYFDVDLAEAHKRAAALQACRATMWAVVNIPIGEGGSEGVAAMDKETYDEARSGLIFTAGLMCKYTAMTGITPSARPTPEEMIKGLEPESD